MTEVKNYCIRLKGGQSKTQLQGSMESVYRKATSTSEKVSHGEGYQAHAVLRKQLADEVARCKQIVDDAVAGGVPPTDVLELQDHKNVPAKILISEAKAKICQTYADVTAKLWENASKAEEASMAPYKKALKGDRWKVFAEHGFININPRGVGGVVLNTPEALTRSPLWCETLGDDNNPLRPTWKTRCYRFKGNTLAGRPVERTGRGKYPPNSAYK
jgi:hypothetical protein